jgi:hypothetical protein
LRMTTKSFMLNNSSLLREEQQASVEEVHPLLGYRFTHEYTCSQNLSTVSWRGELR